MLPRRHRNAPNGFAGSLVMQTGRVHLVLPERNEPVADAYSDPRAAWACHHGIRPTRSAGHGRSVSGDLGVRRRVGHGRGVHPLLPAVLARHPLYRLVVGVPGGQGRRHAVPRRDDHPSARRAGSTASVSGAPRLPRQRAPVPASRCAGVLREGRRVRGHDPARRRRGGHLAAGVPVGLRPDAGSAFRHLEHPAHRPDDPLPGREHASTPTACSATSACSWRSGTSPGR